VKKPKVGDVLVARRRHSSIDHHARIVPIPSAETGDAVLVEQVVISPSGTGHIVYFIALRTGRRGITYAHHLKEPEPQED
jgi:hypothetical protein